MIFLNNCFPHNSYWYKNWISLNTFLTCVINSQVKIFVEWKLVDLFIEANSNNVFIGRIQQMRS